MKTMCTSIIRLHAPLEKDNIMPLRVGDRVLLSGGIYTARDAAHKKMFEAIESGKDLPFDIKGAVIYYAGPTPARPGDVIGSVGPTTSYRMDKYTPALIELGLLGMIGKGRRNDFISTSCAKYGSVYFGAVGGCGALISKCIKECQVIAYDELGSEAVRKLTVEDFPLTVITDSTGQNLFDTR